MKQRMTKTALAALSALLVCGGIAYHALSETARSDRRALNAVYQRAFYETCELMSSLQGNLKKLSAVSGAAKQQEILGEMALQAQGAQSNLAMLPACAYTVSAAMKFVNQIGDYSRTLARSLARGEELTASDQRQLLSLSESATQFALRLNDMLSRYNAGELAFADYEFAFDSSEAAEPLSAPVSDYPVLLYDGPFSDAAAARGMKGLAGREVTAQEALEALNGFLEGEAEEIQLTGESLGETAIYEFSLSCRGRALTAGVTQTGGKVLWMLPEAEEREGTLSVSECVDAARLFLKKRGFGDLQPSDWRAYGNTVTVSLAPVENGAVLYPDLIKAQVSRRDGAVVGLEAGNNYRNHVKRDWPAPMLSAGEAEARLNGGLTVKQTQMAVIPVGLGEKLCWEVRAAEGEDEYLIYIDAYSGAEDAVYQLITTPEGVLAQ